MGSAQGARSWKSGTHLENKLHSLLPNLVGKASEDRLCDALDKCGRTVEKFEEEVDKDGGGLGLVVLAVHRVVLVVRRGCLDGSVEDVGEKSRDAVLELLRTERTSATFSFIVSTKETDLKRLGSLLSLIIRQQQNTLDQSSCRLLPLVISSKLSVHLLDLRARLEHLLVRLGVEVEVLLVGNKVIEESESARKPGLAGGGGSGREGGEDGEEAGASGDLESVGEGGDGDVGAL